MGSLLLYIEHRRPSQCAEAELAPVSTFDETIFMLNINVIPSAARNPYYGSCKKLRDYSAYPPAGYDCEHLLI